MGYHERPNGSGNGNGIGYGYGWFAGGRRGVGSGGYLDQEVEASNSSRFIPPPFFQKKFPFKSLRVPLPARPLKLTAVYICICGSNPPSPLPPNPPYSATIHPSPYICLSVWLVEIERDEV